MQKAFEIIRATRENFLRLVDSLSEEQLNFIPAGSRNNVAWNFGHIIVSQQTLGYLRSGLPPAIETRWIEKYQKGTKPEAWIAMTEIEELKKYLFSLIVQWQEDMEEAKFGAYDGFTTQYGVTLQCIEDVVAHVGTHDALHFGWSKALARMAGDKK